MFIALLETNENKKHTIISKKWKTKPRLTCCCREAVKQSETISAVLSACKFTYACYLFVLFFFFLIIHRSHVCATKVTWFIAWFVLFLRKPSLEGNHSYLLSIKARNDLPIILRVWWWYTYRNFFIVLKNLKFPWFFTLPH